MPSKKPRAQPRFLVDIPVEIRSIKVLKGSGRDLSEDGIRVRLDGHVKLGERVGVTLRIPGFANHDLNFSAEVRWVKRPPLAMGCDAGVAFDHTADTRRRIQLLMRELEQGNMREVERRSRTKRISAEEMQRGI
jgi:PilZ domain-containing protein